MRLALCLVVALTLAACGQSAAAPAPAQDPAPAAPAAPPPLERIRVAYAAPVGVFATPWVAKEAGLFEKYGLDAEVTYIANGPTLIKSMLAGEVQFGELAAPSSMSAYVESGEAVWIANVINRPVLYVLAAPDVARLEDLRDRPVGVTRIGTTTHTMMKIVLRSAGLDAERDVQLIQLGGVPEVVTSLATGRVQAAILGPPFHLTLQQQGMHELLRLQETSIRWPMAGSTTTRGYIAARPEVVRSYLKAYVEAVHLLRTDRERAVDVIARYTDTADRAEVEQSWEIFRDYYTMPPYPEREAMEAVVREELGNMNPRAREVPPQDFYDDRLLRELDDSGFIRQLTGR